MTLTMSGHVVTRFEYPPVTVILDALARPFTHGLPTAGVVTIAALVFTAILMFFLLPSPWRAAAPMICFGFGLYAAPARQGDASIVAVPLLMLALCRWTAIGSGGRLGRSGWLSAVCLGLAAAAQQLTWFVGPFLVAAIFLVRRADLPIRTTARLACAYSAIAAAAFAVVNIPFAAWDFGDWLGGIASPLTQGTFPSGQGLVGITSFFIGGSGALGYYNYAAVLYAAALLACFGLYFRRLGPAVAILPWTILFFAVRGLESYYVLFVVLYAVSLLTADQAVVGRAHQLGGRLRQRLRLDTPARAVVMTALPAGCGLPGDHHRHVPAATVHRRPADSDRPQAHHRHPHCDGGQRVRPRHRAAFRAAVRRAAISVLDHQVRAAHAAARCHRDLRHPRAVRLGCPTRK